MAEQHVDTAKYFYSGLPPWARGVIIVGAFALIVYVGFTIKNRLQNAADAKAENAAGVQAANDVQALCKQGICPTFDGTQYESWSQALVVAIQGCAADMTTIKNIFQQMNNQADVLQLISTFGIRNAQPCGWSTPISYVEYMVNDKAFGGSLPYLMQWGLSSSDLKAVNAVLSGKGISYQF